MVIRILDVARGADTEDQGCLVLGRIVDALKQSQTVIVSFQGVDIATSSFVNSSFVALLRHMTFDELKRRVRIVDANKHVADMIRRRLLREANLVAA
jgi:STAS-like domain of unknown function (DUF4325)